MNTEPTNNSSWMITKMFRGTRVDRYDCLALARNEKIDVQELATRFKETAACDTSQERVLINLQVLLDDLSKLEGEK